jgi:hypothetical protein
MVKTLMFPRNRLGLQGVGVDVYRSPKPLQAIVESFDMQGDGFFLIVLGVFYRSAKLEVYFQGDKFKPRFSWRLNKSRPSV